MARRTNLDGNKDSQVEYPSLKEMAKLRHKRPASQKELAMREDDQNS